MDAVRLYCAAKNIYDFIGAWQKEDNPKLEEYLTPCRTMLGGIEFEAALEEGCAMTMEQAIAFALEKQGS
jgi:hypothetical protein